MYGGIGEMIRVAIVEDENQWAETLTSYLGRYSSENKTPFEIVRFANADSFLDGYRAEYDIVFMDIGLPGTSGMEAAKKLREKDKSVALVFVTNMMQFAVGGYEVDAIDFIVKPMSYFTFAVKLKRVMDKIASKKETVLPIKTDTGTVNISSSELKYVEIMKHYAVWHTTDGNHRSRGALKDIEPLLTGCDFVRCNNCYLVNLKFVKGISGYTVNVGGEELLISHPKRRDFVRAVNNYLGAGRNV